MQYPEKGQPVQMMVAGEITGKSALSAAVVMRVTVTIMTITTAMRGERG